MSGQFRERGASSPVQVQQVLQTQGKQDTSNSGDGTRENVPEALKATSDLIPIFISVGIISILGVLFSLMYFVCRRSCGRSPRFRTDVSGLFGKSHYSADGFGKLKSIPPKYNNGSGYCSKVAAHKLDSLDGRKKRVADMTYGIKNNINGRQLSLNEDEYSAAYGTGVLDSASNLVFNDSSALGAINHHQSPIMNSLKNAMGNATPSSYSQNGSATAYHPYQSSGLSAALPPPNAPAPPPPNAQLIELHATQTAQGSAQSSHAGSRTMFPTVLGIAWPAANSSVNSDDEMQRVRNSIDSPTAYTTLKDATKQWMQSTKQVPISCVNLSVAQAATEVMPQINATEYPITLLRFGEQFGQGVFGSVYKAELIPNSAYENSLPVSVIVKTLSAGSTASVQKDFCREAKLMAELDHPNVLSLLGVSLQHPPWCMIFEIGQYLDVCELLAARRSMETTRAEVIQAPLNDAEKLHIASQVASGMDYLSSNRFVHRDLAARNVLVLNDQFACKITDLGLARDCYASDYYHLHPQSLMLPIRWMPIDSITHGKFTIESDVWSFGVFMWEVWSGGMRPYGCYTDADVIGLIRERQLLPRPVDCPINVYNFMKRCWSERSKQRPTFIECFQHISQWQCWLSESGAIQCCPSLSISNPEQAAPSNMRPDTKRYKDIQTPYMHQRLDRFAIHQLPMENPEVFQNPSGVMWLDHMTIDNGAPGTPNRFRQITQHDVNECSTK